MIRLTAIQRTAFLQVSRSMSYRKIGNAQPAELGKSFLTSKIKHYDCTESNCSYRLGSGNIFSLPRHPFSVFPPRQQNVQITVDAVPEQT